MRRMVRTKAWFEAREREVLGWRAGSVALTLTLTLTLTRCWAIAREVSQGSSAWRCCPAARHSLWQYLLSYGAHCGYTYYGCTHCGCASYYGHTHSETVAILPLCSVLYLILWQGQGVGSAALATALQETDALGLAVFLATQVDQP